MEAAPHRAAAAGHRCAVSARRQGGVPEDAAERAGGPPSSWVAGLWEAQRRGWLTREEAWQIMLDARDAPDPQRVVASVLAGLREAYCPPLPEAEPIVIEDLHPADPA